LGRVRAVQSFEWNVPSMVDLPVKEQQIVVDAPSYAVPFTRDECTVKYGRFFAKRFGTGLLELTG